jgi:TDG/mug DNA glycosylase family protein
MKRLSRDEEERARDRSVPDLIGRRVQLLLVGINPSLSSGATGFHFATPGNRLWPALYGAGLTTRLLQPSDTADLIRSGIGITNLANRATRNATEVLDWELLNGAETVRATVERHEPKVVAVLGIGAFRRAFQSPAAKLGRQPVRLAMSELWVAPNPSGVNAYYTVPRLIELFRPIRELLEGSRHGE